MRRMYRITHKGHTVEGLASSKNNAAHLAFKKLIKAGLIKNKPKTDLDSECGFHETVVEVIENEPME